MAGEDGPDPHPRVGRGPGAGPRPVRHRGGRRRHDARPVPGRQHGDDGDQRRRDRALGHRRQGLRPARLPAPWGALPPAHPGLRQRLVRRREHARGVRRAGAGRGRARLRRAEVRPVWHRLEGPVGRGARVRGRCGRRRARGGRTPGAPDDRVPRPAVGRQRPGDDPRTRALRARPGARNRSRRTAWICWPRSSGRQTYRLPPASGSTPSPTSTV